MMRYRYIGLALGAYTLGLLLGSLSFVDAQYDEFEQKNFGFGINDSDSEDDTIVARKDLEIGGVIEDKEEGFVDNVVKSFINWVLGLLGLIALIISLYGGFMMLTARDNEEAYNKGRTILKNALIGLVIIGTAWFVLSLIFRLLLQSGEGVGSAGSDV